MQKIGIAILLAIALFSMPALAQNTVAGSGTVDILAQGIFEADGSAVQIPEGSDANLDGVVVGNDRALAFGTPWGHTQPRPIAQNELEIKKNQQGSTPIIDTTGTVLSAPLINAEQIKVGDRNALAFGSGTATNHVKIVTNQMGGTPTTFEPEQELRLE